MTKMVSPQIKTHYEFEKKLAQKIRSAKWPERGTMYISAYNEMYQSLPEHPLKSINPSEQTKATARQISIIQRYISKQTTFLELGPGNCSVLFEVAKSAKNAYGIDVSREIAKDLHFPPNAKLEISDGRNIPFTSEIADIVYSNQFIEHLHPDDAAVHLKEVVRVLKKGGVYICITPNRLNGPHDISKYFDKIATCFHLQEYTITDLAQMMRETGFSTVKYILGFKRYFLPITIKIPIFLEWGISRLPYQTRLSIAKSFPMRLLLEVRLIGYK